MFSEDNLSDFDFEELDNEIGLGDLLKQKDNIFISILKKIIFGILVLVIGVMVFYESFTIGKVLFLSDNTNSIQIQSIEEDPAITAENDLMLTSENSEESLIIPPSEATTSEKEEPVVKEAKAIKTQAPTEVIAKTKYVLIAGTFAQLNNAKRIKNQVSLLGYNPEIKNITRNGAIYYRVIANTFTDKEQANKAKRTLNSAGIDSFYIPAK